MKEVISPVSHAQNQEVVRNKSEARNTAKLWRKGRHYLLELWLGQPTAQSWDPESMHISKGDKRPLHLGSGEVA